MRSFVLCGLLALAPLGAGTFDTLDLAVQHVILDLEHQLEDVTDSDTHHFNTVVPYYTLVGKLEAYNEIHIFLVGMSQIEQEFERIFGQGLDKVPENISSEN